MLHSVCHFSGKLLLPCDADLILHKSDRHFAASYDITVKYKICQRILDSFLNSTPEGSCPIFLRKSYSGNLFLHCRSNLQINIKLLFCPIYKFLCHEPHDFYDLFLIERMEYNDFPGPIKGQPAVLLTAGLMAIAFCGFSGLL